MSRFENKIKVWDIPTRLFHWFLVILVIVGLVTGFVSPEWWMGIHIWAGYGTVLLIVFRLLWGIFGSEYSRIETFSFSYREVITHLRELIFLRPLHYIGHNPAGAMMIFALIFILLGITISGLVVLGGEENQGPLAGVVSYRIGDMTGDIHEAMVFVLMALIALHILGVIIESFLTRENLVKSMIDGNKILPAGKTAPAKRPARPWAAVISLLGFAGVIGAVLWTLSTIPPSGVIALKSNSNYTSECGDCHEVYHPSLLPKASWQKLMAELSDHFGEDASLEPEIATNIATYLETYASEAWDTEASNRFAKISSNAPFQISATAYWKRKHSEISADVFKRTAVGGKSHCASCHLDAATGHFDDQNIKIPK